MKARLFSVCILALLFVVPAHAALFLALAQGGQQIYQSDPKDGLRDCFFRFQEDMINYEQGELKSPDDVFDLLQRPEFINKDREFSYLLKAARRLFLITQNLTFDIAADIPDAPTDSDRTKVTLYTESRKPVTLALVKNAKGKWLFSAETLNSQEIIKLYKSIKERYEKLTRLDKEGDTFKIDLMSPYRTMLSLKFGVMGIFGSTLDQAVQTLDLSNIEPVLREDVGRILAVRLYRVIRFQSPLALEALSADPKTETIPIFLVEPGYGAVSMHVVEDQKGVKAWKFTPKSLDVILATYDANIKNILDEGSNPFIGVHLPLDVQVDDLVQKRFPYLEKKFLGVDLWKYAMLLLLLGASPVILWGIRQASHKAMRFLRPRSRGALDGISDRRMSLPLMVISMAYLWASAGLFLVTNLKGASAVLVLLHVVLVAAEAWFMITAVWLGAQWLAARCSSRTAGTMVLVVGQVLKILIGLAAAVKAATILGHDSTRILAALGIGGVALALASKNTVENVFGTLMIVSTRPFAIGHFIIIDDIEGEVEHVGLRSTTIRTFYNSLVTVPNSHFITTPVDNMGKRKYRRFKTTMRLAYGTPPEKLVAFTEGLREIVFKTARIDSNRPHIRLYDFGDSSIEILIYLHIRCINRMEELEIRERFILDSMHLAEKLEVAFAFPTRTVYMRNEDTPGHETMDGERRAAALGREAASLILNERKEDADGARDIADKGRNPSATPPG